MTKAMEEIIRDRLKNSHGKGFQQLVWAILQNHYEDLSTPRMQNDLGCDGYSLKATTFFAVYSPETEKYDNKETVKKIENNSEKNPGDYNKFSKEWGESGAFSLWVFLTRDNLMGIPHKKIVELNGNGDGIRKEQWGMEQLVKLVSELEESEIKRIFNLAGILNTNNEPEEVRTVIDLITFITENAAIQEEDFESQMPDPEHKIYDRFQKFCKEIETEIQECRIYSLAQKQAQEVVGLDSIRIASIAGYLRRLSRRKLREANNDPMQALDSLTDYIGEKLKESGKNYHYNAIRYYLIAEIPKCNIFPNE